MINKYYRTVARVKETTLLYSTTIEYSRVTIRL